MALSQQTISRSLKAVTILALVTGSLDLVLGVDVIALLGSLPGSHDVNNLSPLNAQVPASTVALIDTQLRFLGAAWLAYGVLLWWASNDIRTRRVPLAILLAGIFVGGIGRMASWCTHGFGGSWVPIAMWVELIAPGLLWFGGS